MTKKVVTVYGMLFLFAFTFALSFTLASSARAAEPWCEGCICCTEYCAEYPYGISVEGHIQKIDPLGDCHPDNLQCSGLANRCTKTCEHFTYLCRKP